jgi:hypothetical protein
MPLPPSLSADQRQAALEKAAAVRKQRAELKDRLKMGSVSLNELLNQGQSDEVIGKMKVLAVLQSLPGLGQVKARRVMDEVGISDTRRVQGLGEQQRRKLLEKLG